MMDKLRRLRDQAVDAAQHKLKNGEQAVSRALNVANARAQEAAADAVDAAKHRLRMNLKEANDAAKCKKEAVKKVLSQKAEKMSVVAATKARGIGNTMLHNWRHNQEHVTRQLRENADTLRSSCSSTFDSLKKRARNSASEAVDAAQKRVRSSVSESVGRVKSRSSSVVQAIDLRRSARRARNKLLLLGFVGIFCYGFGSAMPLAMAKYAVERTKREEAVAQTDDATASAGKN